MGILHRMLACSTFDEAARVCETAPRAAAHTYWLCSADRQADWETTATSCVRRDVGDRPIFRSNHCLVGEHASREADVPTASSRARWRQWHGPRQLLGESGRVHSQSNDVRGGQRCGQGDHPLR